jgi:ABC-type phosphate transport system permease subunit
MNLPSVRRFASSPGRRDKHWGDRLFFWLMTLAALGVVVLLVLIGVFLTYSALPSLSEFGLKFLVALSWDPIESQFGALAFVFGKWIIEGEVSGIDFGDLNSKSFENENSDLMCVTSKVF